MKFLLADINDFPTYPSQGVYFDNASQSHLPQSAIDAIASSLKVSHHGFRRSIYKNSRQATETYLELKKFLSTHFGGTSDNYALVPSLDFASNLMMQSFKNTNPDHVVTTPFEDHSIIAPILHNFPVSNIVYTDDFMGIQSNDLVAFGSISPLFGQLRRVEDLIGLAHDGGAKTLVDFSRGILPFTNDFVAIGSDVSIIDSSLQLLGPQGASFVFIADDMVENQPGVFPSPGLLNKVSATYYSQVQSVEKFEVGLPNLALYEGLRASLDYINKIGMKSIADHNNKLAKYCVQRLEELENVNVLRSFSIADGDKGSIVCFDTPYSSHDITLMLDEIHHIQTRSGRICTHLGLDQMGIGEVTQLSFHLYNSQDEIDQFIIALEEVMRIFTS